MLIQTHIFYVPVTLILPPSHFFEAFIKLMSTFSTNMSFAHSESKEIEQSKDKFLSSQKPEGVTLHNFQVSFF